MPVRLLWVLVYGGSLSEACKYSAEKQAITCVQIQFT